MRAPTFWQEAGRRADAGDGGYVGKTPASTKDPSRHREIAVALDRNGFGWLLRDSGLQGLLPLWRRIGPSKGTETRSRPADLRHAFEELGPTFVRLGQFLGNRPDLLPPRYVAELSGLRGAAPPVPYALIVAVVESELRAPIEKVFGSFEGVPLETTQVGQLHAATLRDGEEVIVKVQRPLVALDVERDLAALLELARVAEGRASLGREYDVTAVVAEFASTLRDELDYAREGRNADRLREAFTGESALHLPRVHWDYTTRRVVVLERLRGLRIDDVAALDRAGIDRKRLAGDSARLALEQMFVHGLFHADPHTENLCVLEDGAIGVVDFGNICYLDETTREGLSRLFAALLWGDTESRADELFGVGVAGGEEGRPALERDPDRALVRHKGPPARDPAAARVFDEITALARRRRLGQPGDLLLAARAIAVSEGLARRLDPDFRFAESAAPYFGRLRPRGRSPERAGEKATEGDSGYGRARVACAPQPKKAQGAGGARRGG